MDMGFGNAIVIYTARYINQENKKKQDKLHGMFMVIYCIIGIIAAIFGIILYFNVNLLFGNSMTPTEILEAKTMMLILTFNLVATFPLSIFGNIIVAHEKFIVSKVIKIIQIIMQPMLMVPLFFRGYKAIAMVIVITVVNIFGLLLNTVIAIKKLHVKIKFQGFDFKLLKEIFAYSFFIFLNQIIDRVNWSMDQFILGSIAGTVATAVYAVASQLNNMYMNFSTAISGVLLPQVTKMEDNKASDKEFTDIFVKTGRLQYILMALIIIGFVLFGQVFVNWWAGAGYEDSYYIACVLMIPLTKLYGGIGAAMGTSLALILGQGIILNIYYHKKVGINMIEFRKNIFKMSIPVAISVICGIIINKILISNSILVLLIKIILYILFLCGK